MLIKVFDSSWFDTNGIRLEQEENACWKSGVATRIIFGTYSIKDEYRRLDTPSPEYVTAYNCILINGKSEGEVAEEINKQLKGE